MASSKDEARVKAFAAVQSIFDRYVSFLPENSMLISARYKLIASKRPDGHVRFTYYFSLH